MVPVQGAALQGEGLVARNGQGSVAPAVERNSSLSFLLLFGLRPRYWADLP